MTVLLCLTLAAITLPAQSLVISNARIIVAPGQVIEKGTLVIRDGRIASVTTGSRPGGLQKARRLSSPPA